MAVSQRETVLAVVSTTCANSSWLIPCPLIVLLSSRICFPKGGVENPYGQWNVLELYADGDKVKYIVNGKVPNEGAGAKPARGKILFHSIIRFAVAGMWMFNCWVLGWRGCY